MNKVKHIFWKGSPRKKVGGRNREMIVIFLQRENERCTVSSAPGSCSAQRPSLHTLWLHYGYFRLNVGSSMTRPDGNLIFAPSPALPCLPYRVDM